MWFIAVVAMVVGYLALLTGYVVFVVPVVAALGGAVLALYVVGVYGATVGAVAFDRPRWDIRVDREPDDKPEPAYPQYFFGPATTHLRSTVEIAPQRCWEKVRLLGVWTKDQCFSDDGLSNLWRWPVGITIWAAIVVGVVAAVAATVVVVVLHAVVILLSQAVARLATWTLRGLDSLWLKVRHIRLICHHESIPVSYPRYECPGENCQRRHDVRPGRYGVIRRRCACGRTMPTLLLFGSHTMTAYCPSCHRALNDEFAKRREIVLPLFGGPGAGKSQLMWACVEALRQICDPRVTVELTDDDTRAEHTQHLPALAPGFRMTKTQTAGAPPGRTVAIRSGGLERHLYLYDAAGEVFLVRDRVDDMPHLKLARTYIFVVDPFTASGFQARLAAAGHRPGPGELHGIDPADVYAMTTEAIQRWEVRLERSRLAVAVSKADLVRQLSVGPADHSQEAIEEWLTTDLGLGNLVRQARLHFKEVRFFHTAAVTGPDDQIDASVRTFIGWVLGAEGLPALTLTR